MCLKRGVEGQRDMSALLKSKCLMLVEMSVLTSKSAFGVQLGLAKAKLYNISNATPKLRVHLHKLSNACRGFFL